MKKLLFFFFTVFLFYFAAVYQYSALMILAIGQFLLLLFLTVQTYLCRSSLGIAFKQKRMAAVKGEGLSCEFAIDYQGKLPAGCIKFEMVQGYGDSREKVRLYGNNNNESAVFTVKTQYCGIKSISLKSVRVYDYLLLKSAKKTISDQMRIMVFPKEQILDIRISDGGRDENPKENQPENTMRDIGEEIRQIREYREGDSKRQFHWKLSARMDTMLVKEYERETENMTELFLDLRNYDTASVQQRDAFYVLLSALLLGLLREQAQVNVCWQENGENDRVKMEVTESAQCREVLMQLYCLGENSRNRGEVLEREQTSEQNRITRIKHAGEAGLPIESVQEESLILDMKLCLSQGTKPLYQFSGDHLEEEIRGKQIVVVRGV